LTSRDKKEQNMPLDGDIPLGIEQQVLLLPTLSTGQLRAKYAEVFGEASRTHNRPHLIRRIAWRLQAMAEGGLSERAQQRAAELASDAEMRLSAPAGAADGDAAGEAARRLRLRARELPPAGTVLTRVYRGRVIEVRVLEKGFEYNGGTYRSLSAVATAITGSHWSGFRFFGLNKQSEGASP
jgi:hypothetical protein